MNAASASPNVFDASALTTLRSKVKSNDPQALKEAASQFEALFLQMVLKSMRDAVPREGMFDSEQSRMYESLLDQQLTQVMAKKGGTGLAAMIEKQLTRSTADPENFEQGLPVLPAAPAMRLNPAPSSPLSLQGGLPGLSTPQATQTGAEAAPQAKEFVNRVWPHAQEASRNTGIPPHFLVAQAALETGWGRTEPRTVNGQPSYNLFGLKAGKSWSGATVEASTLEYVNGTPRRQVEKFRAYGSYGEAFQDYAQMLASSPRYASLKGVQDGATFAAGLQRAGYATDPMYAAKLERIISGSTLRQALLG